MEKGVSLRDFADTLQVYQGSLYVNDFNLFGRTWQVIVQAEQQFRDQVEDIPKLQVRNPTGTMVPMGSLANIREINGPLVLTRYNMYPAASINGGASRASVRKTRSTSWRSVANADLPASMAFEWTEMAFLELMAGNTAMIIFGLAVVMVFLVLAAQYESWSLPLAVILVVPMCLLSAIIGVQHGQDGYQHFHADRLCRAGGSGQQERDSDRRVRQTEARVGRIAAASDAGSLPVAVAADRDDLVGVHSRRGAVDAGQRRRRRNATHAGHRRVQRHARRHAVWHFPDAGVFLHDRLAGRHAGCLLRRWRRTVIGRSSLRCADAAAAAARWSLAAGRR